MIASDVARTVGEGVLNSIVDIGRIPLIAVNPVLEIAASAAINTTTNTIIDCGVKNLLNIGGDLLYRWDLY
jgi:hypothetical protein